MMRGWSWWSRGSRGFTQGRVSSAIQPSGGSLSLVGVVVMAESDVIAVGSEVG